MLSVVRTEIGLEERQMEALREMSSTSGKSIDDLVRQAVDRLLESRSNLLESHPKVSRQELVERAMRVSGMFRSLPNEPNDVSTNHDKYLADAIEDRFR